MILQLCGQTYEIEAPGALTAEETLGSFVCPKQDARGTRRIRIETAECFTLPADARLYEGRYYSPAEPQKSWILYGPGEIPGAEIDRSKSPEELLMRIRSEVPGCADSVKDIFRLMELERFLPEDGGVLLHASLVRCQDATIVFSGDSGIGKSTQGRLWEQYLGAEVLNGDRAGLVPKEGIWHAYGLPVAGSSLIFRSEGAPLKAVIMLEQAKENTIRRLSVREAFTALYPQINLQRWNRGLCETAMDNLMNLLGALPVYRLSCRPDSDAVMLVKKTVWGNL